MKQETHKQLALGILRGNRPKTIPFFPDISEWYKDKRLDIRHSHKVPTGSFISDEMDFHKNAGKMPDEFAGWTYLDFYRNFDWGLPVHIYDWCSFEYNNCNFSQKSSDCQIVKKFETPVGTISRVDGIANDGSLCPVKYFVENNSDWKVLLYVIENTTPIANYQHISNILENIGEMGVADIVVWRSPFGKILQEYAGLEKLAYMLMDNPSVIDEVLQTQAIVDMKVIELAAKSPADIVILSDHADQQLLNPYWYEKYCLEFYKQVSCILHDSNKIFSTHLDGNFRELFNLVKVCGFDLLDGCTPSPMTNYEIEELADAMTSKMSAYCGVPSIFFADNTGTDKIITFAKRIIKSLAGQVIVNIGDILPANGDISKAIALGNWISQYNKRK